MIILQIKERLKMNKLKKIKLQNLGFATYYLNKMAKSSFVSYEESQKLYYLKEMILLNNISTRTAILVGYHSFPFGEMGMYNLGGFNFHLKLFIKNVPFLGKIKKTPRIENEEYFLSLRNYFVIQKIERFFEEEKDFFKKEWNEIEEALDCLGELSRKIEQF